MNIITISTPDQFSLIISDLVCISGEQSEEIYHNMWCISLDGDILDSIKLEHLRYFVDKVIENREQQLKDHNFCKSAVFYMWFDQQALQLRFNIIIGDIKSLPFNSKLQLHTTSELILNNFIKTVKDIDQYGDHIEFFNGEYDANEDENEEAYILDVFVKKIKG